MKIEISNPTNLPTIDYKELIDFQEDLKTISTEALEKLKMSIKEFGITFPKAVWIDEGKYRIIDGHSTRAAL